MVERMNWICLEMIKLMLYYVYVFVYFWGEVVIIIFYLLDRRILVVDKERILYEIWEKWKLNIENFYVFGCDVYFYN